MPRPGWSAAWSFDELRASALHADPDLRAVTARPRDSPSWEIWRDPPNGSPTDLDIVLRVSAVESDSTSCTSLLFDRPRGFTFEAGDWVDLRFPTADLAVGRTFSFSSAPSERDLRITYKHGVSPFKRALMAAAPDDCLLITQTGSNGFRLSSRQPAVMIAGGVGIAPFRSMVRGALDSGLATTTDVVFVSRVADVPFRAEIASWQRSTPQLRVHDILTGSGPRLGEATLGPIVAHAEEGRPRYYVAGPPGMVDTAQATLIELGVARDRILTDRFDGYE